MYPEGHTDFVLTWDFSNRDDKGLDLIDGEGEPKKLLIVEFRGEERRTMKNNFSHFILITCLLIIIVHKCQNSEKKKKR